MDQVRLLVLGGTEFVGRVAVEEALRRGWSVTILNRGNRPDPPRVEALRGDRTRPDGLEALGSGSWDVVIDTWSWAASAVRASCELLADRVARYVYVSSRSVYEFPAPAGADETARLVQGADEHTGEYARAKRAGEQAAVDVLGERALLARAGLILGPYENVGRLPWWLDRVARGGEMLAPGPPDLGLQYIDVRDLTAWLLDAAAAGLGGPYNVVSQPGHATMRDLLEACVEATGSDAQLRWLDPRTILDANVEPWTELPVWLPPGELHDAMHRCDATAAMRAGLRCRSVGETVADTWRWLREVGTPPHRSDRPPVGLDPDREAAILAGSVTH